MLLKELLQKNEKVVILLNESNREQFLEQAKKEGFVWYSGKAIQKGDECFFHIMISRDNTIANISALCWTMSNEFQSLPTYSF